MDVRGHGILLEDLIIDGAFRNGISVIEAEDLLVRNCLVKNTIGQDPEAGVDIEPDPLMVTEVCVTATQWCLPEEMTTSADREL